jgi:mRNA-degrading endonuclease RelE of RelBE toxin-antitoxin system
LSYDIYATTHAMEVLRRMERQDPASHRIAMEALRELSNEPYRAKEFLKGEFRGKRKYRRGRMRIIFAVCEECRRLNHRRFNQCADCDEMPNRAIKLFELGFRGAVY